MKTLLILGAGKEQVAAIAAAKARLLALHRLRAEGVTIKNLGGFRTFPYDSWALRP